MNLISLKSKFWKDKKHVEINFLGIKIKFCYVPKFYCPVCGKQNKFLSHILYGYERKNAFCPVCKSLERHRFLFHFYKKFFLDTKEKIKILHTAPEECIAFSIMKNNNIEYVPVDLDPDIYQYCNCQKQDVTDMTFEDNSFDYIISNHVLEHIKQEDRFFVEMLRVLKPGGQLFLSFPISENEKTFEDDNIVSPEDCLKYYGHEGHVRMYGKDVIKRLQNVYKAEVFLAEKDIPDFESQNILRSERLFIITKRAAA